MNGFHYDNRLKPYSGTILLSEYESKISETDVIDAKEISPILQGLFGEVGGVMASAKKAVRDGDAFPRFRVVAEEEFGDSLWYFAALCRRLNLSLEGIFAEASFTGEIFETVLAASDRSRGGIAQIAVPRVKQSMDTSLFALGKATACLLGESLKKDDLISFAKAYLVALHSAELSFSDVVHRNLEKTLGAFTEPSPGSLEDFDLGYPEEEQLPRKFQARIDQRDSGKSYLRWQGVFIGDPLEDNIADADGYRFHDVFHMSNAAILHWSPVIRGLTKQKRKSDPEVDRTEDSGRAIVVEEGVTAWLFSRAKDLNFFDGQTRVSLEILKTVREFVTGYEAARCPLKLWERAILRGYEVFRQVRDNNGGWVVGDRENRTIHFEPFSK